MVRIKKPTNSQILKEPREQHNFNKEQLLITRLILDKQNIFFTGSAGTGKSYLLRKLIVILQEKYGKNKVGVSSLTGTGAEVIGGTTLASLLGLKSDNHLPRESLYHNIVNSRSEKARKNWKKLKVLIIDEISMLDGELFDKLEWIGREIRMNNWPFGKLQLVLVGDFCQLPPVANNSRYAFEAESWSRCIPNVIKLSQIYRQKDEWFIAYLEDIRFGRLSPQRHQNLLSLKQPEPHWPEDGIKPVSLFATNQEVQGINEQELNKLTGKSYFFMAKDEEKVPYKLAELVKSCIAPIKLELKIGAQVMLIFNWHEKKLVNGSQGAVIGFAKGDQNLPIVRFTNGKELVIEPHTWDKIEGYDKNNEPIITACRIQIPLILSWAMTIHKSQGQTLERLKLDLSRCFMPGQIYTALSRASDPNYLQIINFPLPRLWCNDKVREYYRTLKEKETNS
jgi:ATP-dependent DNA helicase PIF1